MFRKFLPKNSSKFLKKNLKFNSLTPLLFTQKITHRFYSSMFSKLSSGMKDAMDTLTSRKTLTRSDIENSINSVRLSLIDADVALPVVKKFISEITQEAIGTKIEDLTKSEAFSLIIKNKLTKLLGEKSSDLNFPEPQEIEIFEGNEKKKQKKIPLSSILVTGIQGSGSFFF
jgi:signal recognition particle GTPase